MERGGRGARCSLSYIDLYVAYSSQVARLELHIQTASVGADIGGRERQGQTSQGEEKRSLSP